MQIYRQIYHGTRHLDLAGSRPIGKEQNFKGLVNVLTGKAYMYKGDGSKDVSPRATRLPIWHRRAVRARERPTRGERAVEEPDDEALVMRYLDGEELSLDELLGVLRKAVCAPRALPDHPRLRLAQHRRRPSLWI